MRDESVEIEGEKEIPQSVNVNIMKKSNSDSDLTKRRSVRVRIGSVELDDIGVEISMSFGKTKE